MAVPMHMIENNAGLRSVEQELALAKWRLEYERGMIKGLGGANTASAISGYNPARAVAQQQPDKTFDPNRIPAMQMPLSALVDLTRAKYGDTWVNEQQLDDAFWIVAFERLSREGRLEEYRNWMRIRESA